MLSSDGHPAFNEETLVGLQDRVLRTVEQDGMLAAAVVTGGPEAEFAVDPGYRRKGLGAAIVRQLLAETPGQVTAWAHGNHPAAQILAARFGFLPIRTLLQLQAAVPTESQHPLRQDIAITGFRPGADDDEWLALNARVFAGHPEQGRLDREGLQARLKAPWFSRGDFLLAREATGRLVGYCWVKVDPDAAASAEGVPGEFYVIGVDPEYGGRGIGGDLLRAGLAHLRAGGIRTAYLYVEADNTAAVSLYRSLGFTDQSVDVRYRKLATVS